MTQVSLISKDGFSVLNNINPLFPVGSFNIFATLSSLQAANSTSAGTVWLRCNGASYNKSDYPILWEVLANAGGSLTTSTTFNTPNLQSRFLVGDAMPNTGAVNTNLAVLISAFNSNTSLTAGNSGSMIHSHNTGNVYADHAHNWGNAHNDGNPSATGVGSGNVTNASGQSHNHTTSVGGGTSGINQNHQHAVGNSSINLDHAHNASHSHSYSTPAYIEFIFAIKAK